MTLHYSISFHEAKFFINISKQGSRRILYWDTLSRLATQKDLEILAFLKKIHTRFSRQLDTLSFQQIECAPQEIFEAMRLLSQTDRIFYKGHPLHCDWNSAAKIYWREEEGGLFSAHLQYQECEIPISSCEKVFPSWCIWEKKAFLIESSVAWKWIDFFLSGPVFFEERQRKRFLEEDPPISWRQIEVIPRLLITDAIGCFANLSLGRLDWEKDLLEAGYIHKVMDNSRYFCPSDRVYDALLLLLEVGWEIFFPNGKRLYRQTRMQCSVHEQGSYFSIQGEIQFQQKIASLQCAMQVIQRGRFFVDIDHESVGLLDRTRGLSLEGKWTEDALQVEKCHIAQLFPMIQESHIEWQPRLLEAIRRIYLETERTPAFPGNPFHGELLTHQQRGVDWLALLYEWGFSGLLADEMGLGKTVQVLAFFSRLKANLPILIIAPSSLLIQWQREIERFLPSSRIYLHAGSSRIIHSDLMREAQYVISSYALLRLDSELFSRIEWEVIVLDESNAIKTATTQTAKAACQLKGRFKVALSGTPIENHPEELRSQFQFLMPGLIQTAEIDRRAFKPFILRRKKEELHLPEKLEQLSWVGMDEEQARVYQTYKEGIQMGLLKKIQLDGCTAHRVKILEAILRLRQIAVDPRLMGREEKGAKIERLLVDLQEAVAENRKILIYSQFTSMLSLISRELTHSFLYLDGSISPTERAERVRRFQEDADIPIFLLSLKAGGVGLNLTAADYVFLFDPWWNDAVESQAISRAHRIGQRKTVIAKRYLTPGTIEEKMLQLKAEKQKVAENLLDDAEEGANWTEEDWLYLLS